MSWKGPSEAAAKLKWKKVELYLEGKVAYQQQLKKGSALARMGQGSYLSSRSATDASCYLEGLLPRVPFWEEARNKWKGTSPWTKWHQGPRGLWLCRNRNPWLSQLCFVIKAHLPSLPNFVKALNPPKLGSVHSFANMRCGVNFSGSWTVAVLGVGLQGHHFYCMTPGAGSSSSRPAALFGGALFWLWNQKQPLIWCFLLFYPPSLNC